MFVLAFGLACTSKSSETDTSTDGSTTSPATTMPPVDPSTGSSSSGCSPLQDDGGGTGNDGFLGDDCASGCSGDIPPACEPVWTGCGDMEWLRIDRIGHAAPNKLLGAASGELTFLTGDIEAESNDLLRFSADSEIVWDIELPFAVRDVAISDTGAAFVSGFDAGQNHPWFFIIAAYGSDGQLAWSRTDPEAAELVDIECSVVTHDATAGWLAACVRLVEVGGDGIYRLHNYDDAGKLISNVAIPGEYLAQMEAIGDGDVLLSGRDSGAATALGTLARVDIATGVAEWELELDGPDAPEFAVADNGTIGVLSPPELHGIAADGELSWTVPIASEAECHWIGWEETLSSFGDTFVIVGADTSSPSPVIHQISAAGEPVCSDGPPVVGPALGGAPVSLVAGAGDGAWVLRTQGGSRCLPGQIKLLRTVTP